MPIYDFRCPKCGLVFEVSRPRDEAGNPASCPNDGTEAIRNYASVAIPRSGMASSSASDFDLGGFDDDDDFGGGHSHGPGTHTH